MTKKNIYKIFFAAAVLLLILFAVLLIIDAVNYNRTLTSAPFWIFVMARAVEFILPCIVVFIIGLILKRRYS